MSAGGPISNASAEAFLSRYAAFLVDVDGVLVHGKDSLPGASAALAKLQSLGRTLVLTNNSSRTRDELARYLSTVGLDVRPEDLLGSSFLAARYLSRHVGPTTAWVLGEEGIRRELTDAGHRLAASPEDAEWVVVGIDRQVSYASLALALRALIAGARILATNEDATFPTPDGLVPGAGALVGALRGMGFPPTVVVGKPSPEAFGAALDVLGVPASRVLMIGDRLDTDIMGAAACGLDSALVLTGISSLDEAQACGVRPTWVARTFVDLCDGRLVEGRGAAGRPAARKGRDGECNRRPY